MDVAKNQKIMAGIYFIVVLFFQFVINASSMATTCGGSVSNNIAAAAGMTIIPRIFIFGVMMIVIMVLPGMKSVFSDVIGYFAVSYSANRILAELLLDPEVDAKMKMADADEKSKAAMQSAAQAIVKLMGNVSILINQVVPANFAKFWSTLIPLMKPQYSDFPNGAETQEKKKQFLNLAILRDNVGESCWYLYTGILLIMIIQNNIVNHKCDTDPQLMNNQYEEYLKQEEKKKQAQKAENSINYKM